MSRALVVVLAVAGCAKQIAPVGPHVGVRYLAQPGEPRLGAVGADVLMGRPIEVHAAFEATCREDTPKVLLKHDDDSSGHGDPEGCQREPTTVAVACKGPCTVNGTQVIATGPGTIEVSIELTSSAHHHAETRTYNVVQLDAFRLACANGAVFVGPGEPSPGPCHTKGSFDVYVVAKGNDYTLPVTVRANGKEKQGTNFEMTDLFDSVPSNIHVVPDGSYEVELLFGALTGRAVLVVP